MTTNNTAARKPCPITRTEFASQAKPLACTIDSKDMPVDCKEFSTGSFGWYGSGKVMVRIDGKLVNCQVAVTVTVIGSKEAVE